VAAQAPMPTSTSRLVRGLAICKSGTGRVKRLSN
jgi:hypothetical protein